MVAALWLLVLSVVGGAPGDPTAASLEATLRGALAGVAEVRRAPEGDGAWAADTRPTLHLVVTLTTGPSAAAEGGEVTIASLSLVQVDGGALTREVVFHEGDAPSERGRTLAFVTLSMLPDVSTSLPGDLPEPSVAHPRHTVSPGPTMTAPRAAQNHRVWLEFRGVGTLGLGDGGATTAWGGALGVTWAPWARLGLRADLSAQAGEVEAAQASTTWLAGTLGLSVVALRARGAVDLDLEVWLGVGAGRQSLSHYSEGGPAQSSQAAWALVGRGGLALSWQPRRGIAVLAELGADLVASRMPVYVADELRATLEPLRPTASVGVRVSL